MVSTPGSFHNQQKIENASHFNQRSSEAKSEKPYKSSPSPADETLNNNHQQQQYYDYSRDVSPPGSEGQVMTIASEH